MSKIGKKPIIIPNGVEVKIAGGTLSVKGRKGELKKVFPSGIMFDMREGKLAVKTTGNSKQNTAAIWGLSRALAANMIKGVDDGFQKTLEFSGVGYKAQVKGDTLELSVGLTHPVSIRASSGITFRAEKNTVTVEGTDREIVGHFAAKIRAARPPEPYKGSGIKYRNEVIRRKTGKKAAATGTAA